MSVDQATIDQKLKDNKPLNEAEQKFVLESEGGPEGFKPPQIESEETTVGTDDKPEGETETGKAQAAEEAQAKKELSDRAKAVGLPETATAAEITAKEEEIADNKDPFVKIERELAKPEGKEDLASFSDREKAYFHQMRRDRKARQQAEGERDAAKFELLKNKKPAEKTQTEENAEDEVAGDPLKILEGRDPTDFLTIDEVKKILTGIKPKAPAAAAYDPMQDPVFRNYLDLSDKAARAAHTDYDEVMELIPELISNNKEALVTIAQAIKDGKNPAETHYELIKNHPDFTKLFPAAQVKAKARKDANKKPEDKTAAAEAAPAKKSAEELEKERKAKVAQEKLEQNKTKTTGSVSSSDDAASGEMSLEEVSSMSDRAFAKLPKSTRAYWLKKMKDI